MPLIAFRPSGKTAEVLPGTELLDAARKANVAIDSPCGGKGTCGKCLIKIISGEVEPENLYNLPKSLVDEGYVLACKTKILNTPVIAEVREMIGYQGGKFGETTDDINLIQPELLPKENQFDYLAVKLFVKVPEPQSGDGLSDSERLSRSIQKEYGKQEITYPLPVIRMAADALRKDKGNVTVTLIKRERSIEVIHIEPGNKTVRHFGIAVDVGTTTVVVKLIYLPLAKILGLKSEYNEQIACGLDVISRINYARRPDRLAELQTRVLNTLNRLIQEVCESNEVKPDEICNAVISGNTTMIHLLLGLNPDYIRLDPYTPTVHDVPLLTAQEIGINIHPHSRVYFSPGVGSYVGGDITAGILCTDLSTDSHEYNLFIDIGTNGEVVIGNNEILMTCACSAGPAFEGGGIEYGMRAALGAIESVQIDEKTGKARYKTVGEVKPKGICGSGMIDILAKLFLTSWIDNAGKLSRTRQSDSIAVEDKYAYYIVAPAEESAHGNPIRISELDIENIIRAKAAIYSACSLMLEQIHLKSYDLSHIYIAGGFGRSLNLENAITIGLIPDLDRKKFKYIGNSSLMGSYMILVSQKYRERQNRLARCMTYLDLSAEPNYMNQYTGALFLPHTDINKFPTVKVRLERK